MTEIETPPARNTAILRQIVKLGIGVYGREGFKSFKDIPRAISLDGKTPRQAIAEGNEVKVFELLVAMDEGTLGS